MPTGSTVAVLVGGGNVGGMVEEGAGIAVGVLVGSPIEEGVLVGAPSVELGCTGCVGWLVDWEVL
jgi:hypothetical protein